MNIDYNPLLNKIYEVEGLILLARENKSSLHDVLKLAQDKLLELYKDVQGMSVSDLQDLPQESSPTATQENFNSISIAENNSIEDSGEDERSHGNLEDDYDNLEESEDERSHGNLEDDYYNLEESEDERSHGNFEDDYDDLPFEMTDLKEDTTPNDDIDVFDIDEEQTENYEINDEDIVEIEDEPIIIDEEIITLDEKIARMETRDLKHAFTVNDRYRFRRELFCNSDTQLTDTINLVSAMSSMSEAEEYFYEDLEWERDNEEVKDFMKIISHYFSNK